MDFVMLFLLLFVGYALDYAYYGQIYIENPPYRIPGSELGIWVSGAENGVLRRLSAPNSATGNFMSPV
ncbi:hypothetical protein PJP14_29265, partial [Mycobacterium kansasii]